jgi:hypothetical protein
MADELIDGHVSVKQCKRAITALLEYALKQQQKREENELLPGKEEYIWLQVSVKRVHAEAKLKPRRMCVTCSSAFPHANTLSALSSTPSSIPVTRLSVLLLRTHSVNTKISLSRQASSSSVASLASRNSRESSNRSRHGVRCFARMSSSSPTTVSSPSFHVSLGRSFSLQKST